MVSRQLINYLDHSLQYQCGKRKKKRQKLIICSWCSPPSDQTRGINWLTNMAKLTLFILSSPFQDAKKKYSNLVSEHQVAKLFFFYQIGPTLSYMNNHNNTKAGSNNLFCNLTFDFLFIDQCYKMNKTHIVNVYSQTFYIYICNQ